MMLPAVLFSLLAADMASAAVAAPVKEAAVKRTTDTVQLYAFGTDIDGYAVYAGSDNLAYIVSDEVRTNMTALTWTIDSTGTNAWTVQANTTASTASSSTSSLAADSVFYVVTSDAAFEQAGFVSRASDVPSGATTTGLATYGPYVMLLDDGTTNGHDLYTSEFWATNSSTDGVWSLRWNNAGSAQDGSVPVSLRTKAPSQTDPAM